MSHPYSLSLTPLVLAILLGMAPYDSAASVTTPSESKNSQTAPNSATTQADDEASEDVKLLDQLEGEVNPFTPHWTGKIGLSYSNQPSQAGQGQITKETSFTGTYSFTEGGHYTSLGLVGGQQKTEGTDTDYGELSLEGGLGLDFFLPSLNLMMQRGSSALQSDTATLTLGFMLWEPLEAGMTLSGGLDSHQGTVSQVLGTTTKLAQKFADKIVEIDGGNLTPGIFLNYTPADFLTLTLSSQQAYDDTYQVQNVTHTVVISLNQEDRVRSITLGANITFLKNFELDLSGQSGQEDYPAGTVYSLILGKTVTYNTPTSQPFKGFSFALNYNID